MPDINRESAGTAAENMSREELRELNKLFSRFVQAYGAKPEGQSNEEWLQNRMMLELPELSAESAASQSRETTAAIRAYDESMASLLSAIDNGQTESEWFAEQAQKAELPETELAARLVGLCESLGSSVEKTGSAGQEEEWTSAELHLLGKLTGDRLMLAGVQSAITFAEYQTENFDSEQVRENDAVALALETGRDVGLKTAVAGALTIAVRKKIIHMTVAEAPTSVYANLACASIENVKTAMQVADNKLTESEGVDRMAANTAVAASNLVLEAAGRTAGSTALSWIPVIGPIVGGILGGITGKMVAKAAGPVIYEKVEKAKSPIAARAKQMVKKAGQAVNKGINTLKGFAKKIFG